MPAEYTAEYRSGQVRSETRHLLLTYNAVRGERQDRSPDNGQCGVCSDLDPRILDSSAADGKCGRMFNFSLPGHWGSGMTVGVGVEADVTFGLVVLVARGLSLGPGVQLCPGSRSTNSPSFVPTVVTLLPGSFLPGLGGRIFNGKTREGSVRAGTGALEEPSSNNEPDK
ncbi:hypothetical protein BJY04DRAFT_145402 [Aspergillus karnatakaensis]|uniref:uncharacterized protein n=1 Tax=Aspergillus karnatakaensis TaxID=1810916 RepID=UPI003CCE4179